MTEPVHHPHQRISDDVVLGKDVSLVGFVNLYGCIIGDRTKIGPFVEIQKGVTVGRDCKISSHSFLCEGVVVEDQVFVGHGVMFTNDLHPRATNPDGSIQGEGDWECQKTRVCKGASIGSGVTILGGLEIGAGAMIGAGSVVTRSVAPGVTVAGNPAREIC